jgi:hypothetical protein
MNLLSFIHDIHGRFGKNEVAKSCELTLVQLNKYTLPAYQAAGDLFKATKLGHPENIHYEREIKKLVKGGSYNMFDSIVSSLQNAGNILTNIESKADEIFAQHESNLALSYKKATYLRLVAALTFGVEYARRFLNYVYVHEQNHLDSAYVPKEHLTPAEMKYITDNFLNFCTVLSCLNYKYEEINKKIMDLPDAQVTELTEQTYPATIGAVRIDPLNFNNFILPGDISARANPFYLIGTVIASFQVAQYTTAENELELLQMRRLNLEKLRDKSPSPALERELEKLEERVDNLRYERDRLAVRYGV